MGRLALDLGDLHRTTGVEPANASVLFHLLHKRDLSPWLAKLPAGALEKTAQRLEEIVAPLARAELRCADAALVREEFELVVRMLRHGLQRALTGREDFVELRAILEAHRSVWLARNRPGGLDDSQRPLREKIT